MNAVTASRATKHVSHLLGCDAQSGDSHELYFPRRLELWDWRRLRVTAGDGRPSAPRSAHIQEVRVLPGEYRGQPTFIGAMVGWVL